MHLPVVLDQSGTKLSKQTGASAIDLSASRRVLFNALEFLQQAPPPMLREQTQDAILEWAIANWDITAVGNTSRDYPN